MRRIISVSAVLLIGPMLVANQDLPALQSNPLPDASPTALAATPSIGLPERNCRDTIQQVRQERGLPMIQRDTADADEPILFAALDYDIDGCDVLLTAEGPQPLPLVPEGPITPQPAQ